MDSAPDVDNQIILTLARAIYQPYQNIKINNHPFLEIIEDYPAPWVSAIIRVNVAFALVYQIIFFKNGSIGYRELFDSSLIHTNLADPEFGIIVRGWIDKQLEACESYITDR